MSQKTEEFRSKSFKMVQEKSLPTGKNVWYSIGLNLGLLHRKARGWHSV